MGVFFEGDEVIVPAGDDGHFLGQISDEGYLQDLSGTGIQREITVQVRGGSDGCSLHHDTGTDHGSRGVDHGSRDPPALLLHFLKGRSSQGAGREAESPEGQGPCQQGD